jgi:transposase
MEARTVNNLPPAAAHDDAVRCLFAIEMSNKSWIVAVNTPLSEKISRYVLAPYDGKGVLKLMVRIGRRIAEQLGKRVEIVSCYEAGYDGVLAAPAARSAWRVQLCHRSGERAGRSACASN